jgi:uncharacterized BrkB/YihY/UPF0761 family membrane protein
MTPPENPPAQDESSDVERDRRRLRAEAFAAWTASSRRAAGRLPGAPIMQEIIESERVLGGTLIEAGVAFRFFLWLVPFGLLVAAVLSFWSRLDPTALENEVRRFGVSAAAAHAGAHALEKGDRGIFIVLPFAILMLAWFTLGAVRALVLAYALAWQVDRPRIRRPVRAIALFNALFLMTVLATSGVAWLHAQLGGRAWLGTLATLALLIGIALLAMWFLPHADSRLLDLLPGACLIAAGYQVLSIAVLFYFAPRLGRAEETYGAFGTAATMLVWLYVLARLVVGAAFLNSVLRRRRIL